MSLGTGCLWVNPGFDDGTGTGTTSSSGAVTTTTGASAAATGDGGTGTGTMTGGTTTGATTGETTGGSSTGGPFCGADVQAQQACSPLADSGLLVCDTVTTWADAKASCEAMCGRLAVIHGDAERLAFYALLRARMTAEDSAEETALGMGGDQPASTRASYWLGASATEPNVDYVWLDGTILPGVKDMYGWGVNDPDYSGLCLAIGVWGKAPDDGEYFDRICDTQPYRYLCDPG